jgi:hypothetical protein
MADLEKEIIMRSPHPHPVASVTRLASAPGDLEKPEADLWRSLVRQFKFDDEGSLEVLAAAMRARMRARRCTEAINREGECWRDNKGNLRPHPLIAAERSARASFIQCMRLLRLDGLDVTGNNKW